MYLTWQILSVWIQNGSGKFRKLHQTPFATKWSVISTTQASNSLVGSSHCPKIASLPSIQVERCSRLLVPSANKVNSTRRDRQFSLVILLIIQLHTSVMEHNYCTFFLEAHYFPSAKYRPNFNEEKMTVYPMNGADRQLSDCNDLARKCVISNIIYIAAANQKVHIPKHFFFQESDLKLEIC